MPAAGQVGVTSAVNPQARGTPPGAPTRTLVLGNEVIFKERIETSAEGLVQVLLLDGSTFTVAQNSDIVIDEFVYDPASGTGKLTASVSKGIFRFIGGKLSKQPDAVNVNTPVGTIGIRGAIVDCQVHLSAPVDECELVFGNEVTFTYTGSNQRLRVYEQGYGFTTADDLVRRTPPGNVQLVTRAVTGTQGKHGGAVQSPTDEQVGKSQVPGSNSDQTIFTIAANTGNKLPPPQTNEIETDADLDETGGPVVEPGTPVDLRVLASGNQFEAFSDENGYVVNDPGAQGLVGGSPETDRIITFNDDGQTLAGNVGQEQVVLPVVTTPGTTAINDASIGGQPLAGSVFVGEDGALTFYQLFVNGSSDRPFYALGGTPTPDSGLSGDGGLRSYSLTADPQQGIVIPFARADVVGEATGASVSDFLLLEPSDGRIGDGNPGSGGVFLQGALEINGQGADQRSSVMLVAGPASSLLSDDAIALRRGGSRTAADQPSIASFGRISTIKGPEGNRLFGEAGDHFVLSSAFDRNGQVFVDAPLDGGPDDRAGNTFSTVHVATLAGETPASELDRTTRRLSGYAAGMLESATPVGFQTPYRSRTNSLDLRFNAETNTVGGEFTVSDVAGIDNLVDTYRIAFGRGINGNQQPGQSAFIDDDRYGALNNQNPARTTVTLDNGTVINHAQALQAPKTYFLGSELVPTSDFVPEGVELCACEFLEWGYWGTRTDFNDPDSGHVRDQFHLGTWAAGDVTNEFDMPTTGNATFRGHAIGNVARQVDGQTQQYVAAGNLKLGWDFGTRQGRMTISKFDGETFRGTMSAVSNSGPNRYSGALANATNTILGGAAGSFVNGPKGAAQGTIGAFDLVGQDFSAAGTFVGRRK